MFPLNGFDNEWEAVTGLNFLLKLLAYSYLLWYVFIV
jgi:hypothetical protein